MTNNPTEQSAPSSSATTKSTSAFEQTPNADVLLPLDLTLEPIPPYEPDRKRGGGASRALVGLAMVLALLAIVVAGGLFFLGNQQSSNRIATLEAQIGSIPTQIDYAPTFTALAGQFSSLAQAVTEAGYTDTPSATPTATDTPTFTPSATPAPTDPPETTPTEPLPEETDADSMQPSSIEEPEATPEPEVSPDPEMSPEPEVSPDPEVSPESEMTPDPEMSPESEMTPEPEVVIELATEVDVIGNAGETNDVAEFNPNRLPVPTLTPEVFSVLTTGEQTINIRLAPNTDDDAIASTTSGITLEAVAKTEGERVSGNNVWIKIRIRNRSGIPRFNIYILNNDAPEFGYIWAGAISSDNLEAIPEE